jgi:hypothetical protein
VIWKGVFFYGGKGAFSGFILVNQETLLKTVAFLFSLKENRKKGWVKFLGFGDW